MAVLILAACRQAPEEPQFPKAHRDVAPIVGESFSTEDARDRLGEAEQVIRLAGVAPGMSVADIGAGEGYYTVRLAPVVGRLSASLRHKLAYARAKAPLCSGPHDLSL